jgi:hypothetical protein
VKTELNRLMVLAITLRSSRTALLEVTDFMLPEKVERFANALESIDHVAEELERIAAEPAKQD